MTAWEDRGCHNSSLSVDRDGMTVASLGQSIPLRQIERGSIACSTVKIPPRESDILLGYQCMHLFRNF